MTEHYDPITLEIIWNRLISIVDEAAATLLRTSFSTVLRESNDFACVLLDSRGNSLAQSTLSVPSFIGTLPISLKKFLEIFPPESLEPGDVIISNDPWICSGHLPDVTMAMPIFRKDKLIAFAGSIGHAPDMGGRIRSGDSTEIYEEGLQIPPSKLVKAGQWNEDLVNMIKRNVRVPDMVMGDFRAQIAADEQLGRRLLDLVEDQEIENFEKKLKELEEKRDYELSILPNIPFDDIPASPNPKDNVSIKEFGKKREFDFKFRNHLELNEKLQLFNFKRSAKISGTGWPLYTSFGARLEWALINYMIDTHIKNGFTQIMPPLLVKDEIMYGSGQLPKFKDQLFKINDEDFSLFLVPTAEVALNGMYFDEILEKQELPKYFCSYTPCFRREAGAAGKQERGLIRMHQFNKVELFAFTTPDESEKAFEKILQSAEEILEGLNLHYRNMLLVTGDMSFGSAKTIDIEVFLPGQDRYYEVSSVSNCTDFQARRSKTRFRENDQKPKFVNTLNGSGLATSRLVVAILENFQNEDGSVEIPKVLQKYMENEISIIKPTK